MKKLLVCLFVVLFLVSTSVVGAISKLDTNGKYFGYIINQKDHPVSVYLLGTTKTIDTGRFWKMKLSTGKYYLIVNNPCGKIEKFTMNINLCDIEILRGPWIFYIEDLH